MYHLDFQDRLVGQQLPLLLAKEEQCREVGGVVNLLDNAYKIIPVKNAYQAVINQFITIPLIKEAIQGRFLEIKKQRCSPIPH